MPKGRGRLKDGEDREEGERVTRALWCPRCALAQGFTLYSESRETRAVRWGLVALPRARCDYCNRHVPEGQIAAAVTFFARPSDYRRWEEGYLYDMDTETHVGPDVRCR